jgi:hypothetical protein
MGKLDVVVASLATERANNFVELELRAAIARPLT